MITVIAAANGRYTERGNPANADCVIGHSFGARENEHPGSVNQLLAQYIIERTDSAIPLLLQGEIAAALETMSTEDSREPALTIIGSPTTTSGKGLDSWKVLEEAGEYMNKHRRFRPLLVGQAFHIGRVARQATTQGMDIIVPRGLPRVFDPDSMQPWTTNQYDWARREIPGMLYLIAKRKL